MARLALEREHHRRRSVTAVIGLVIVVGLVAIFWTGSSQQWGDDGVMGWLTGAAKPDELPVMLNRESPFRYPISLYTRRVQGNVTLRLYVDERGYVRAESTKVAVSSGHPSLDSSAVAGSQELQFSPARDDGEVIGVSVLIRSIFATQALRHFLKTRRPAATEVEVTFHEAIY